MKKAFSSACLALGIFSCYSQSNYLPGYILLANGDTVRGNIDYRQWEYNPETIQFQKDKTIETYAPSQISGFGVVNHDIYRSFKVTYTLSPAIFEKAGKAFSDKTETRVVFLRLLHRSPINLYSFANANREYFFIQDNTDEVTELVYRVRVTDGVLFEDEQYKNVLAKFITDDNREAASRKLASLKYRSRDLIEFVTLLYGNTGATYESSKPRVKTDIEAGVAMLDYKTTGLSAYQLNLSPGIRIGGGLTFSSRRNFGRLQSRVAVNFNYIAVNGKFHHPGLPQEEEVDGHFITIQPITGFGWVFTPLNPIKHSLHLEAGFHFVLANDLIIGNITSRTGFASAGLKYLMSGKFGGLGIDITFLSNFLDTGPTGPGLTAKQFAVFYRYIL